MQELNIQWSTLKTVFARDNFILYYVAQLSGVSTYSYDVFGTNQIYFYRAWAAGADATDFENNYKTNAIAAASHDDAVALIAPAISTQYQPQQIWVEDELTTTSVTASQVVVSYTVATGYDFYMIGHSLSRLTDNGNEAVPAVLEVISNGVPIIKIQYNLGTTGESHWNNSFPIPLKLASSTDVLSLTVTPTSSLSTDWAGRISGFIRTQS